MRVDVLHLITQDDQPLGSVRQCCEKCGLSVYSPGFMYTDNRDFYRDPDAYSGPWRLLPCDKAKERKDQDA